MYHLFHDNDEEHMHSHPPNNSDSSWNWYQACICTELVWRKKWHSRLLNWFFRRKVAANFFLNRPQPECTTVGYYTSKAMTQKNSSALQPETSSVQIHALLYIYKNISNNWYWNLFWFIQIFLNFLKQGFKAFLRVVKC